MHVTVRVVYALWLRRRGNDGPTLYIINVVWVRNYRTAWRQDITPHIQHAQCRAVFLEQHRSVTACGGDWLAALHKNELYYVRTSTILDNAVAPCIIKFITFRSGSSIAIRAERSWQRPLFICSWDRLFLFIAIYVTSGVLSVENSYERAHVGYEPIHTKVLISAWFNYSTNLKRPLFYCVLSEKIENTRTHTHHRCCRGGGGRGLSRFMYRTTCNIDYAKSAK